MFKLFKELPLFFLEQDGGLPSGGGEGDPGATDNPTSTDPKPPEGGDVPEGDPAPTPNPTPEPTKPEDLPKYSSQLDPKNRESEDYKKYLYKHKSFNEIADNHVALSKRMEKAIEIPGKDATPEQVKSFFTKLGVPESGEGYDLPDNGIDPNIAKPLADKMREEFIKAGMTKVQGKNMWNFLSKNLVVGQQNLDAQKEKKISSFDSRLEKQLEETYPVKAEREGAMKETMNLFKQHVSRTGLGKVYKESGLLYNTDFILAISKDEKVRSGSSFIEGQPGAHKEKSTGAFGEDYSPDFKKYGGK